MAADEIGARKARDLCSTAYTAVGLTLAGFLQFGTLGMAALIGGGALVVNTLEGNLLTPWLTGRASRMNPVVQLLFADHLVARPPPHHHHITTQATGRPDLARVAANFDLARESRAPPALPGPGGTVG